MGRIGRLEANYKGVPLHYLITGHTGFKGAWLAMWLTQEGHEVSGLSLDPIPGALFETARVAELLKHDIRGDIRDLSVVKDALNLVKPDVVFHLAAQPLVRESYQDPRGTIETNVIGTMNLLSAVAETPSVKAHVVITTDKVYKNVDQIWGYKEIDPLGGDDPYSASKAMADILTQSWIKSFEGPPTAIARAGNVIGGGDVSKDRLFPDLLNGFISGQAPVLRYPSAVRPWQHVLDCLNGYMKLSNALLKGNGLGEWNFGPETSSFVNVGDVATYVQGLVGKSAPNWTTTSEPQPHEANLLALDARKAELELDWCNKLSFEESLKWTVDWQTAFNAGESAKKLTIDQISRFK
jgi:CDP-glucose 4,6-dehydratase